MTQEYTGMRKGISLVEMVIAIVLFAALATIGLKYTKQYLDTDLQAKKARVAALTDQANQLTQAYNIYKIETGMEPASIADLNGSSRIMTAIPTSIKEIGTGAWELNSSVVGNGTAFFTFKVDGNGTTTGSKTDEEYCAIFNREFNSSAELNVTEGQTFGTVNDLNATFYAMGNYFCYSRAANDNWIVIVVP